jgi:hypothetical protein
MLSQWFLLGFNLQPENEGNIYSGSSVDFQGTVRRYIPEDSTLQEMINCENFIAQCTFKNVKFCVLLIYNIFLLLLIPERILAIKLHILQALNYPQIVFLYLR